MISIRDEAEQKEIGSGNPIILKVLQQEGYTKAADIPDDRINVMFDLFKSIKDSGGSGDADPI